MPSWPHLYRQETPESCVPACLRLVLSTFGQDVSEERLRQLCDCTSLGTDALKAVEAARQFGFKGTRKYTLTVGELATVIEEKTFPIVFVGLGPLDGVDGQHAMVVVQVTDTGVRVYDPMRGERLLSLAAFSAAWAMMHNLAIIIER